MNRREPPVLRWLVCYSPMRFDSQWFRLDERVGPPSGWSDLSPVRGRRARTATGPSRALYIPIAAGAHGRRIIRGEAVAPPAAAAMICTDRRGIVIRRSPAERRRLWQSRRFHHDDWRAVEDEVEVADLAVVRVFSGVKKPFQLQSFENLLQRLQILGRFLDSSKLQSVLDLAVNRHRRLGVGENVAGVEEAFAVARRVPRRRRVNAASAVRFLRIEFVGGIVEQIVNRIRKSWRVVVGRFNWLIGGDIGSLGVSRVEEIPRDSRFGGGSPELRFGFRFEAG